ncbi:MAG: HlyD family efflux transporter periplasmic adaptor subunit [Oscillospiraceae bacterium]|nr:HlyD family efflux transporter periplasmic adaptor subunit [Oscillospiraceae bacterium]
MNEENKTKKRGWVQTAVIIFLSIMLVLTFFSNTIMNANLPEVAVQYVDSGTISAQIRGQATIKATESFEVVMQDTRKVRTVYAKVGQQVETGDLLFLLAAGDSQEIETAKQELEAAETELQNLKDSLENSRRSYQRSLLEAASAADYTKENRNIQKLREEISEKTKERDELDFSDTALKTARDALEEAEKAYEAEQKKYDEAQDALLKAKNEAKKAKERFDTAEEPYNEAKSKVEAIEAERAKISSSDASYASVQAARDAYDAAKAETQKAKDGVEAAKTALETAHILYDAGNARVTAKAEEMIIADYEAEKGAGSFDTDFPGPEHKTSYFNMKYPTYIPAAAEKLKDTDTEAYDAYKAILAAEQAILDAENEVKQAELREQSAYVTYDNAYDVYAKSNADSSEYSRLSRELNEAKKALEPLETAYKEAQKEKNAKDKAVEHAQEDVDYIQNGTLAAASSKKEKAQTAYDAAKTAADGVQTKYDTLTGEIENLQTQLEDALFQLSEQKKSDQLSKKLKDLDLQAMRSGIDKAERAVEKQEGKVADAQEKLDALAIGAEENGLEVRSDVNGVVKTVSASAGTTPQKGEIIATIEVPDRGYSAEMSVTTEQADRVTVGDNAKVSMGWWGGSDIQAKLVSMRADPQSPRDKRILVFEVTGSDVESGANINIAIGERSRNYDTIIPKSALRSDTNGDFVLRIITKQTPLSTRYIAERVAITKVAEDDTMVAVTSDLSYNDCLITTTSAPISSGMQVRLADET